MRNRHSNKLAFAGLVLIAALFSLACLNAEGVAPPPGSVEEDRSDRTDCVAIGGTAFHSDAEREWYSANCSAWPPIPVDPGPARSEAPRYVPPPAECIEMRGKPYTSRDQRDWYLANCLGNSRPAQQGQGGSDQPPAPPADNQANRTNCDAIRGTRYESPVERDWYLQNCPQAGGQQQAEAGPPRTDCNEIRGTSYRSAAERAWYLSNCPPAITQDRNDDRNNNGNDDRENRGRERDNNENDRGRDRDRDNRDRDDDDD